jgi:hypothetical protein
MSETQPQYGPEREAQPDRTFSGTGNPEVDKLIANTVQRSIDLLVLLRDVATVLGLREDDDRKTKRRLKEYVKVGMRRDDHVVKKS